MQPVKTEAYFYNPGMTSHELEDWLGQQQHAVKCFNSLIREKAELEERLSSVNRAIKDLSQTVASGKQSYPWCPTPRPESHQTPGDSLEQSHHTTDNGIRTTARKARSLLIATHRLP